MSDAFELDAKVRTDLGKGASRRLRRLNDDIPAVIYGGNKDPVSITLAHKDIAHAVENEAFFSHIITINMAKKSEQVIIKDLQRHPAKPFILHADFLRVSADEEITVNVPVHFLNEDKCNGVKVGGGSIIHALNEIEISCLPKDLPAYIEVDMLALEIGDAVHLSDVNFPKGVTCVALSHGDDSDPVVANVMAPMAAESAETEEPDADAAEPDKSDAEGGDQGEADKE